LSDSDALEIRKAVASAGLGDSTEELRDKMQSLRAIGQRHSVSFGNYAYSFGGNLKAASLLDASNSEHLVEYTLTKDQSLARVASLPAMLYDTGFARSHGLSDSVIIEFAKSLYSLERGNITAVVAALSAGNKSELESILSDKNTYDDENCRQKLRLAVKDLIDVSEQKTAASVATDLIVLVSQNDSLINLCSEGDRNRILKKTADKLARIKWSQR
jgi:hypothetical protein